jgi:hypothetical protein
MTTRRTFLVGSLLALMLTQRATAQDTAPRIELVQVLLPESLATPDQTGTPDVYAGDDPIQDLWWEPWLIGDQVIDAGGTIIQRFPGTDTQGYELGTDGLIVRSALLMFNRPIYFLLATNTDLSEIPESQKSIGFLGGYGGVHYAPEMGLELPIVIAHELVTPE